MTKLISALIIIGVLFVGWNVYLYWDKVQNEDAEAIKREEAKLHVDPGSLQGMPYQLEQGYQKAVGKGPAAVGEWLKVNGAKLEDPRKGWIEMDYAVSLSQNNPVEARRVFNAVRERTSTNSPIYPRMKQLEKTYK
jgi:hypothetical protein